MRWSGHVARMEAKRVLCRVLVGKPEGRNHLKDPGIDGTRLLKCVFKKWDGDVDWIDLAQDRERWRAVVNAVMNLRVP